MSRDLWITKQFIINSPNFQIPWIRRVRRVEHTTSESFCYVLVRKSYLAFDWAPTLGAKGFSFRVSGFGQVLKSDPREPLVSSAFGRRNEAPRRTREKTCGTQGTEHQAIARQSAVYAERGPDLALSLLCFRKIPFLIKIFFVFPNPAPYPRSRKCLPEFQWSVSLATTVKLCSI